MGYNRHHAIVVTSRDPKMLDRAHLEAVRIFGGALVSSILDSKMNGVRTFVVAPDGSKEGWAESDEGNAKRDEFVTLLREENERALRWVEVQYGDDEHESKIVRVDDDEEGRSRFVG